MAEDSKPCQLCAAKGIASLVRLHQVTVEEAIYFCDNPECLDLVKLTDVKSVIVSRNSENCLPKSSLENNMSISAVAENCEINSNEIVAESTERTPDETTSCSDSYRDVMELNNILVDIVNTNETSKENESSDTGNASIPPDVNETQTNCTISNTLQVTATNTTPTSSIVSVITANTLPQQPPTANHPQYIILQPMPCSSLPNCGELKLPNELFLNVVPAILPGPSVKRFPQWFNKDNLCWLDVTLNLIIHNTFIKKQLSSLEDSSIVKSVITAYDELVSTVNSASFIEESALRFSVANTPNKVENVFVDKIGVALEQIRDTTFDYLKAKLGCLRGQEESPIFALPHLLQEYVLQQNVLNHCIFEFECDECKFRETRSSQKVVLTLPRVAPDFTVLNAVIMAPCSACHMQKQKRKVKFEKLPNCLIMHFVEGLPTSDILQYDFIFKSLEYKVTAVVQYKQNPNHFIVWIRNVIDNLWMECDDLKLGPSFFHYKAPIINDGSECHVLVWEYVPSEVTTEPNKAKECADVVTKQLDERLLDHLFDHLYIGEIPDDFNANVEELIKKQNHCVSANPVVDKKVVLRSSDTSNAIMKAQSNPPTVVSLSPLSTSQSSSAKKRLPIYSVNPSSNGSGGIMQHQISVNPNHTRRNLMESFQKSGVRNIFNTFSQEPSVKRETNSTTISSLDISEITLLISTKSGSNSASPAKPLTLNCESVIQLLRSINKSVTLVVSEEKNNVTEKTAPSVHKNNDKFKLPEVIPNEIPTQRGGRRGTGQGRARGTRGRGRARGSRGKGRGVPLIESPEDKMDFLNKNEVESTVNCTEAIQTGSETGQVFDGSMNIGTKVKRVFTPLTDSPLLQYALESKRDLRGSVNTDMPVEAAGSLQKPNSEFSAEIPGDKRLFCDSDLPAEVSGTLGGVKRKASTILPISNAPMVKRINGTTLSLVMNNIAPRGAKCYGSYQSKAITENN